MNGVQDPGTTLTRVDASVPASGAALKAGLFPQPAPEILDRLEAAGAKLRRDGALLRAGPAAALSDALRDEIRANKDQLLAEIDRRTAFVDDLLAVFDGATLARRSLL